MYKTSEVEKLNPSVPYYMKPSWLLSIFILLVKNGSDTVASRISSGDFSQSYSLECKTLLYSEMAFKLLEK